MEMSIFQIWHHFCDNFHAACGCIRQDDGVPSNSSYSYRCQAAGWEGSCRVTNSSIWMAKASAGWTNCTPLQAYLLWISSSSKSPWQSASKNAKACTIVPEEKVEVPSSFAATRQLGDRMDHIPCLRVRISNKSLVLDVCQGCKGWSSAACGDISTYFGCVASLTIWGNCGR